MQDGGEFAGEGDLRALEALAFGDSHRPCLQGRPAYNSAQDHVGGFIERRSDRPITEEKIAAFTQTMRANVLKGDSVIDQVEADDEEIRIIGRRTVFGRLATGGGAVPAGVPSFVRKWRARHDSNV